jgi:hypothetical protein
MKLLDRLLDTQAAGVGAVCARRTAKLVGGTVATTPMSGEYELPAGLLGLSESANIPSLQVNGS